MLALSLPTFSFLVPELKRSESLPFASASVPNFDEKVEGAEAIPSESSTTGASFKKPVITGSSNAPGFRNKTRPGQYTAARTNRLLPVRTSSILFEERPFVPAQAGDGVAIPQRRTRWSPPHRDEFRIKNSSQPINGRIFGNQFSSETDAVEQGYQLALLNLFEENVSDPGLATGGGNPFQDALDQQNQSDVGTPELPAQQPPPSDPPATAPPSSGNPPEPDPPMQVPSGHGNSAVEAPESLSFLIVGDFDDQQRAQRAARRNSGEFVLEDGGQISLFSGTFGIPRTQFIFEREDKFISGDLNGDGVADVVRATRAHFGTILESYIRDGSRFERQARSLLPYQNIGCMSLFGVGRDGFPQLALVINGNPNLLFFSVTTTEFRYSRELSLPLAPVLLADVSLQGPYKERRLYIMGPSLGRGYYLSSRFPESLLFSWNPLAGQVQSFEIEVGPENFTEFHTIRINQRMLLFQQMEGGVHFMAGINLGSGLPMLLLGDFLQSGHWQMVYFP